MRVVGRRALALAIVLGSWLPGTGRSQQVDSAALGPRLSLETVVARTLAYSPGVTGALGAVRDAAPPRRGPPGADLPRLSPPFSAALGAPTTPRTPRGAPRLRPAGGGDTDCARFSAA